MILPPLLTCVLLGALSAQAEVVQSFDKCNEFFYKGTEPAGMDQNTEKICQLLNDQYHYATLYSTHHRIPIYSAYTFNREEQQSGYSRRSSWFIEPQISSLDSYYSFLPMMTRESELDLTLMKIFQAISSDYSGTGYDRGHLNPNCYQCDEGRDATFTLTNAAPMHPCFNQVYWSRWERGVREFLKKNADGTVYIVTGTVPHPNYRIPQREEASQASQEQSGDEYERVTVPTHIWTAVCYEDPKEKENSFSFGYIGVNEAESSITMMPVNDLNSQLAHLYGRAGNGPGACRPKIFVDECFCSSKKYEEITVHLKRVVQPTALQQKNNFIQMTAKRTCSEKSDSRKRVYSEVGYDSMTDFSEGSESMKRYTDRACVLTQFKKFDAMKNVGFSRISDLSKRDVDQGLDAAVQCQEVPEKSDPTAATAADGTHCQSWKRFCETKNGFKPCCSTPCLYEESRKGYWCRSGQTEIQCSPQYSAITVKGEKCKDDHQCGKHGEDYYWCKTSSSWEYCSPPLWESKTTDGKYCRTNHACAKYGKGYTWCYTDSNNNWNYCCDHDDCFSATDGKTCKPNHPCGYHDQNYLWCHTTDGSWHECCTPCS